MNSKGFLFSCSKTKALLIGDVMLDRYVIGKVNRISPEAPVPVFLSENSKQVLGGAGNVFNNLISIGVSTTLITAIGKDNFGNQIEKILNKVKKNKVYLFKEKNKQSTVKTRYSVNGQQLIRVDEENTNHFSSSANKYILKTFKKELMKHNVVILSDYGKGIFSKKLTSELIKLSNLKNIPIIVDPKNKDFNLYKNAFLLTPNQLETLQVTNLSCNNDKEATACGKFMINKFSIKNVLITRGDKGLSYINKSSVTHCPTKKIEVFDVSGAGDTVLAIISVCIANKLDIKKSLQLANNAAGKVVGKIGTSTIKINELFEQDSSSNKKITSLPELKKIIKSYKKNNIKIGFTNGCFDILHLGHIKCLEESKKLCDKLIVAINSDASIKKIKGDKRPINNQETRLKIIASLDICDHVIVFKESTPIKLINALKPSIITKGGDYKKKDVIGHKEIKKWNGQVHIVNYIKGLSTTKIITKLS
jgi:D-beta-D-heptose 7-phosphate kinase/D-beta-D-heptose 1-phosphate adenosyltransferase